MEQAHARRPRAEEEATAPAPLRAVPEPDDRESPRVRGARYERPQRRGGSTTEERSRPRRGGRAPHDAFLELAATSPAYRSYLNSGDAEPDWDSRPDPAPEWGSGRPAAALEDDPFASPPPADPALDLDIDDLLAPPADRHDPALEEDEPDAEPPTRAYREPQPRRPRADEAGRRTIRIGAVRPPLPRGPRSSSLSLGANPDRLALWAVILALLLALVAAATARGEEPGTSERALQGSPPVVETHR